MLATSNHDMAASLIYSRPMIIIRDIGSLTAEWMKCNSVARAFVTKLPALAAGQNSNTPIGGDPVLAITDWRTFWPICSSTLYS
jgi:hypothetical protein